MPTPTGLRLRQLASPLYCAAALSRQSDLAGDPQLPTYDATAGAEYNAMTSENALKLGDITSAGEHTYDWTNADAAVAFAQANGQTLTMAGPLIWGGYEPAWLSGGTWTASTLTASMYNWIDTITQRYRGSVAQWHVVAEPIQQSSTWATVIGPSYADLAFRRVQLNDPNTPRWCEEWGGETVNSVSNAYYTWVQGLVTGGTPISGAAFECHLDVSGLDYTSFATNMARFAALGVSISINELDVKLATDSTGLIASSGDLATQGSIYYNVASTALAQPSLKSFITWGFTDNWSWIPSSFPGNGAALPFDGNYAPKAAYYGLQAALQDAQTVRPDLRSAPVMARRAWQNLQVDSSNTFVTAGFGTHGTTAHVPAGLSTDGSFGVAYFPNNSFTITVNLAQLRSVARGRWYDLGGGTGYQEVVGSPFCNSGTRTFTPPGPGDWMLLFEAIDPGMSGNWVAW